MKPYKRRVAHKVKPKKRKKLGILILLILAAAIASIIFIYFNLSKVEKFTYVEKTADGGASVKRVDVQNGSIYEVSFSPETEVDLSFGLGKYKLSSAWVLGDKEGHKGKLVSKTLASNYSLPVYLWKSGAGSNLQFNQMVKLKLIDLGISRFSYEKFTVDSNANSLPYYVLVNFVDPYITEKRTKLDVEDASGYYSLSEDFSSVVDTMGAKITGYARGEKSDIDCTVSGKDEYAVTLFSKMFSCDIQSGKSDENFDVKMKIGTKFAENF